MRDEQYDASVEAGEEGTTAGPNSPSPSNERLESALEPDLSSKSNSQTDSDQATDLQVPSTQREQWWTLPSDRTSITELLRGKDGAIYQHTYYLGSTKQSRGSEAHQERVLNLGVPAFLQNSLLLPTDIENKLTEPEELFNRIRALVHRYGLLNDGESRLATYWAVASWFADVLPYIPSLSITGPVSSAHALLRVLRCVCRRPVMLASVSPVVLRAATANDLMPTLLIRVPKMSATTAALLDASNHRGYFVSSGKYIWQFYGAKCIYLGDEPKQQVLSSDSLHVHTNSKTDAIGALFPAEAKIQDLQNKLLLYRVIMYSQVEKSNFKVTELLPELRECAQVLSAPFQGSPDLQKGIVELLKDADEQVRVDRSFGRDAMVLRAVLWHCHQPQQEKVFVHEIAATVNRLYREMGEPANICNEVAGHVLKKVGLYTCRLGSAGRGLRLDKTTQFRAHELCVDNAVAPRNDGTIACGFCHSEEVQQQRRAVPSAVDSKDPGRQ